MAAQHARRSPAAVAEDWHAELSAKLGELAAFPPDWDGYGSDPPNATAVDRVRRVFAAALELDIAPSTVVPSAEGGVGVYFGSAARCGDIECFNTGEMVAVVSDDADDLRVWEIDAEGISSAVEEIRDYVQR